jgi:hypothetical protein
MLRTFVSTCMLLSAGRRVSKLRRLRGLHRRARTASPSFSRGPHLNNFRRTGLRTGRRARDLKSLRSDPCSTGPRPAAHQASEARPAAAVVAPRP